MIAIVAQTIGLGLELAILYAVLRLTFDFHQAMGDLDQRLTRIERDRGH